MTFVSDRAGVKGRSLVDVEFWFVNRKLMRSRDNMKFDKERPMVVTSIVGLCVGGILAQNFRALALVPATAIGVLCAAATALIGDRNTAQTLIEVLAIALTLQSGYLLGSVVKQLGANRYRSRLKAVWPQ